MLRSEIVALQEEHAALISEITSLQSTIKAIQQERSLLETDYSLNESTFKTLKTKLEEVTLNYRHRGWQRQTAERSPPTPGSHPPQHGQKHPDCLDCGWCFDLYRDPVDRLVEDRRKI